MKTLTIMELATLISAVGTLALAVTSVYQMRRVRKDSLHPMVYADAIWMDTEPGGSQVQLERIFLRIKNYGTGPAIDLRFNLHPDTSDRAGTAPFDPLAIVEISKGGQRIEYMNLAPSEEAQMELRLDPMRIQPLNQGQPLRLEIGYRSVFRQNLCRFFTIHFGEGHTPITNVSGSL